MTDFGFYVNSSNEDDFYDNVDHILYDISEGLNSTKFGVYTSCDDWNVDKNYIVNNLDLFITQYLPNINFLIYKKLYVACVNIIIKKGRFDYYGNQQRAIVYQCDIEKLYDFLIENKLFSENDLL